MNPYRSIATSGPSTTRAFAHALCVCALLALGGCASNPKPPTAALQAAQQAIGTADKARIEEVGSPELREARDKLAAAHRAVGQEEMLQAERLAQQSRVAAELAVAKSEAAKASAANVDLQEGIDALEEEMNRNAGDPQ